MSSHLFVLSLCALLALVHSFPFVDKDVSRRLAIEELTLQTTDACKRKSGLCLSKCADEKLADDGESSCGPLLRCCHSLPSDGIYDCEERTGVCRPEGACKFGPLDEAGRCDRGHVCCVLIR